MKPVTALLLGAYGRGRLYANYAMNHPDELQIVAVAEINPQRREMFCAKYGISTSVATWEELLDGTYHADAVIIALPDYLHYTPCMKAIELGYDILLEKPMAQTANQCHEIVEATKSKGTITGMTYVLRYSPYFMMIKQMVDEKLIGDIVSIEHMEPVSYQHFVLSYVRGSWKDSVRTTPLILAKSSHDLDIFHWLIGKKCTKVAAMGGVSFFKAENAPAGSGERCLECACESECAFSALKIHFADKHAMNWVLDLSSDDACQQQQEILDKLATSDYGKCVFRCHNNQPDHYAMLMEFEGGVTVNFSVEAMTSYSGRHTRIMGTKGDLVGDMEQLVHTDFLSGKKSVYDTCAIDAEGYKNAGHGGGDEGLIQGWVRAVREGEQKLAISFEDALASHLMGFAAEEYRTSNN